MSTIAMAAGTIAFCLMTLFVIESSKSMPLIDAVIYKNIVTGLIFYAINFFTKEKTSKKIDAAEDTSIHRQNGPRIF
ncbi:hypothetical protein [Xanthomonas euvesicatoria]|uniref:hypothetical protein n=1 Tax=Xanthomonas euvesicatoria TaxID=456327 RepID=UPI001C43D1B9|nr:hypothetical protein [Xanthomonas euvesicatoria]MBV6896583.1 hypothetical protein [Xanthomonas campestris pv. ionidii]